MSGSLILYTALTANIAALAMFFTKRTGASKIIFHFATLAAIASFALLAALNTSTRPDGHSVLMGFAASWSGAEGSFFLWCVFAYIFSSFSIIISRKISPGAMIVCLAMLSASAIAANPFHSIVKMNESLANTWMIVHPPVIFAGYAAALVPLAQTIDSMISKTHVRGKNSFLPAYLTALGIILGAFWAYESPGWNGYWSWDPVENASLAVFLFAFAFYVVPARNRKLTAFFAATTAASAFYAAFITRSGMFSGLSIHSFASSDSLFAALFAAALFIFALFCFIKTDEEGNEPRSAADISSKYAAVISALFGFVIMAATSLPAITSFASTQLSFPPSFFALASIPFAASIILLLTIPKVLDANISLQKNIAVIALITATAAASAFILGSSFESRLVLVFSTAMLFFCLKDFLKGFSDMLNVLPLTAAALLISGAALSSFDVRNERLFIPESIPVPLSSSALSFIQQGDNYKIDVSGETKTEITFNPQNTSGSVILKNFYYDTIVTPIQIHEKLDGSEFLHDKKYLETQITTVPYAGILRTGACLFIISPLLLFVATRFRKTCG